MILILSFSMLTLTFNFPIVKADTTITVYPTGIYPDDVENIQWVLDNYIEDITIILEAGTFNFGTDGSVNLSNDGVYVQITITGTVDAFEQPLTTISGGSSAFVVDSSTVSFEIGNITFTQSRGKAIEITACAEGIIENCEFTDVQPSIDELDASAIFASEIDGIIANLIIRNNEIDLFLDDPESDPNCDDSIGVFVNYMHNTQQILEIDGNSIRNVPDASIFVNGFHGEIAIIEDNSVAQRLHLNEDSLKFGIAIFTSDNILIRSNSLFLNPFSSVVGKIAMILSDVLDSTIEDNFIDYTVGLGILANGLDYSLIQANTFSTILAVPFGVTPIRVTGSHDTIIRENSIERSGTYGLFIDSSASCEITDNDLSTFTASYAQLYFGSDAHDNMVIDTEFGNGMPIIDEGYNNIVIPPLQLDWQYVFEDEKHGTTLKIDVSKQIFQFVAPGKDFSIKKAENMKIGRNSIVIRYEDKGIQMIATIIMKKAISCYARVKDLQTGNKYNLIAQQIPE